MLRRICVVMIAVLLATQPLAAKESGLKGIIKHKSPIKVYIKEVLNHSGQSQLQPIEFKKSLERAFVQRKSMKFELMPSAEMSDIEVSAIIKKYQYLERGPLKNYVGTYGVALDLMASATENYVEMAVEFIVQNAATKEVLWTGQVNPYIKQIMKPEESIPLISDKVSRDFLWRCFGKKR